MFVSALCLIEFGLVRRQQWWPKRHPSSLAGAQNIVIDQLHYYECVYILVLVKIIYYYIKWLSL
jgi:hypothetical protein